MKYKHLQIWISKKARSKPNVFVFSMVLFVKSLSPDNIFWKYCPTSIPNTHKMVIDNDFKSDFFYVSFNCPINWLKTQELYRLILIILNSYLFPIYIAKKILKQSYPKLIRHSILQPIFYHHTFYILRKSSFRPFAKIESNSIFLWF